MISKGNLPSHMAVDRDRFFQDSEMNRTMMSTRPIYDPYLENLKSPLIKDESDGKTLRLRFVQYYSSFADSVYIYLYIKRQRSRRAHF